MITASTASPTSSRPSKSALTASFMISATRRCPACSQWRRASRAGVTSSSGSSENPIRSNFSSVCPRERAVVLVTNRRSKPISRRLPTASGAPATGSPST